MIVSMVFLFAACGQQAEAQTEETVAEADAEVAEVSESSEEQSDAGSTSVGDLEAFDDYTRPRVVSDGKLTIAYIHGNPDSESQIRSTHQAEIEVAHRGWELVEVVWPTVAEFRDNMLNLINQDVDAIMIGNVASMESYQDLIDLARENGIGVYNNDNMLIPGVIANATMPNGVAAMDLIYTIGQEHYWTDSIAFITKAVVQVANERIDPIKSLMGAYSGMEVLATEDIGTAAGTIAYDITRAWIEKYGDELTGVIGFADLLSFNASEAISAAGDPTGEKTWVAGFNGGSQAYGYIRDNTPYQYSYSQPFEAYTHNLFELIDQIQVQGINPGDEGCLISFSGATIYTNGLTTTRANVPEIGANIHSVFDYYGMDPNDENAWFNWTEEGGPYTVIAGQSVK